MQRGYIEEAELCQMLQRRNLRQSVPALGVVNEFRASANAGLNIRSQDEVLQ